MYSISMSSVEKRNFKVGDFENSLQQRDSDHVLIDLSSIKTAKIFPKDFLPLASIVMRERERGLKFSVSLPNNGDSIKYLKNSNLLHLLEVDNNPPNQKSLWHIPFLPFFDGDSQYTVVNKILDYLLELIPFEARSQFSALEWCISEITDNAITHAGKPKTCLTGVRYNKLKNTVSLYVSDGGFGIANTIKEAFPNFTNEADTNAIMFAIEEHVTSKKDTNFGMGLYGTYRMSAHSGGEFRIISNGAEVLYKNDGRIIPMTRRLNPFHGTYVEATINLNSATRLKDAFLIEGKPKEYFNDYLEIKFSEEDSIKIIAAEYSIGGTNRKNGVVLANTINNILVSGKKVTLDFTNFGPISSSFVDEVFGKLSLKFKDIHQIIDVENLEKNYVDLINDIIERRFRQNGV